jgi:Zn-dependent peptidase ImmA (M78 family)
MIINGIYLFDEPNKSLITPSVKNEIMRFLNIIKQNKVDLSNHADFIGYTIDFNLVSVSPEKCGGYFDSLNKEVAICENSNKPLATICHELGHAIQDRLGLFNYKETFSYQVKLEQQAETIAYNLYSALIDKDVDHKKFDAYFKEQDIIWLSKYYNGFYEQDLL